MIPYNPNNPQDNKVFERLFIINHGCNCIKKIQGEPDSLNVKMERFGACMANQTTSQDVISSSVVPFMASPFALPLAAPILATNIINQPKKEREEITQEKAAKAKFNESEYEDNYKAVQQAITEVFGKLGINENSKEGKAFKALILAIIRTESSFNPRQGFDEKSWGFAQGGKAALIDMKTFGLTITKEMLDKPTASVIFVMFYLKKLLQYKKVGINELVQNYNRGAGSKAENSGYLAKIKNFYENYYAVGSSLEEDGDSIISLLEGFINKESAKNLQTILHK